MPIFHEVIFRQYLDYGSIFLITHRVKWCHRNLWSYCNLYVVEQQGVLREVKW